MEQTIFICCPACGGKTRDKIRQDTELKITSKYRTQILGYIKAVPVHIRKLALFFV